MLAVPYISMYESTSSMGKCSGIQAVLEKYYRNASKTRKTSWTRFIGFCDEHDSTFGSEQVDM